MRQLFLALSTIFLLGAPTWPATAQESEEAETEVAAAEAAPKKTHKSGYRQKPVFGGPNSTEGQLEEDDQVKKPAFRFPLFDRRMEPWFEWKEKVNEAHGFQISGQYVSLYQGLGDSLGEEDEAASGLFRLNGKWTVVGRGTKSPGSIAFTVDQRHAYTDIPPSALAGEAGYIGLTGALLSDFGFAVINLNWQQGFHDGNTGLVIGRFDPSDYMNVLGYANPWTAFQNLAIFLDASVAFPDSSWGVGAGQWIKDKWYVIGSVNDANGLATDDFEFLRGGSEFFTQAGVGWSPSKGERYFKTVVVTGWHVDEREDLGIESFEGLLLSANWTFDEKLMPFVRLGVSDGSTLIYNTSVTAGFIRRFAYRSDLLGLAVNWGESPMEGLPEQITTEAFYRWQIAQNLAVTPSVQWLVDPALNEEDDEVWLVGLRLRMSF